MASRLSTFDHSRDSAGLTYVYPVLSRRAGGLSIGINFNINNACNWRCVYCQVPDLTIGAAPEPDLKQLETELRDFLHSVASGEFYHRFQVPETKRRIQDIAISGNGEPTSAPKFAEAVKRIGEVAVEAGIFPHSRFVLITNGSLVHQPRVREGLRSLRHYGGEVWFKLDSATDSGRHRLNNASQSAESALRNLVLAANLCPTAVQICLVDVDKQGFPETERNALLDALAAVRLKANLFRIYLYTLARPSLQPEAPKLEKMPSDVTARFADDLRVLGFQVSIAD